jgi:hypothetical protein
MQIKLELDAARGAAVKAGRLPVLRVAGQGEGIAQIDF